MKNRGGLRGEEEEKEKEVVVVVVGWREWGGSSPLCFKLVRELAAGQSCESGTTLV